MEDTSKPTEEPTAVASVWTVEDNDAFRRALERSLNLGSEMQCTLSCGSCEEAFAALESTPHPNVIFLDINLPGLSGVEGLRKMKELAPSTEFIMLTIHEDHGTVMQALCAGATGYLTKTASPTEIRKAVTEAINGGVPMTPQIARSVLNLFTRHVPPVDSDPYNLSKREKEVLKHLAEGKAKKEIAGDLNLSYHTIDKHVRGIYSKLQVHSLSAAVAKAVRERLY